MRIVFAQFRGRGIELIATRVPTKVHVFTGMPHPFLGYDIPSAKVCQTRVLESIRWALADGDDQVDKAWIAEPTS